MAYTAAVSPDALERTTNLVPFTSDYTMLLNYEATSPPNDPGDFPTVFYIGDNPQTLYSEVVWIGHEGTAVNRLSGFTLLGNVGGNQFVSDLQEEPHWVAYTRSGTTHRLYVDGVLFHTWTEDVSGYTAPTHMYLGTDTFAADWNDHRGAYFREWTAALTAQELQSEMGAAAAVRTADLHCDCPLQGDFLDDSGNGFDLVNTNGSSSVAADGPTIKTRLYFTRKYPNAPLVGRAQGPWAGQSLLEAAVWTPIRSTQRLATSKLTTGRVIDSSSAINYQPDYDSLWLRYVTDPLAAQTISGTFDWMNRIAYNRPDPVLVPQADASVRSRVYIYVTQGDSTLVRGVLLDYVDTVDYPFAGTPTWRLLAAPQTLSPVACQDGDRIMIEVGVRVVSMPVVDPTYPPTTWTRTFQRHQGAQDSGPIDGPFLEFLDAVAAETTADRVGWCEFSQGLQFSTAATLYPGPDPTVGTFANPIIIPGALPYRSPAFDTTGSTQPGEFGAFGDLTRKSGNALYFQFTPTQTGYVFFLLRGTNYPGQLRVFNVGGAEGALIGTSQATREIYYSGRSGASTAALLTSGVTYWVCVANQPMNAVIFGGSGGGVADNDAADLGMQGGLVKLEAYYQDFTPLQNDLYVLIGALDVLREQGGDGGDVQLVNLADNLVTALTPTAVAIDYTRRPMASFETASRDTVGGVHSGYRVLIGSFSIDLQEIFPIDTLSWTPSTAEVDFMDMTKGTSPPAGGSLHQTNFHITPAGLLYTGNWGNGFQLVVGQFASGSPPAILDALSELPELGTVFFRDIIQAESQAGAPWPDGSGLGVNAGVPVPAEIPDPDTTTCSYITIDDATQTLYYTSGGWYSGYANPFDVSSVSVVVKRYNIPTRTQLADLGPFPTFGSAADSLAGIPPNPGLHGIQFVPKNNTLLVCNADRIMQINAATGAIIKWFIPVHPGGLPDFHNDMIDIVLTAEQDFFWAKDGGTGALYKFNLETGAQTNFHVSELIPGTTVQMQIFLPGGFIPPVNPEPCPEPDGFSVGVIRIP
jgi:hypothetical protein